MPERFLPRLFPNPEPEREPLPEKEIARGLQGLLEEGYTVYARRGRSRGLPSLIVVASHQMLRPSCFAPAEGKSPASLLSVVRTPYAWETGTLTYTLTALSTFSASREAELVAFVLHASWDESTLYWALKHVFKAGRGKPSAIISDHSPEIRKVFSIWKEIGGYQCPHLLDPEVFFEEAAKILGVGELDPAVRARLSAIIADCSP